jgi:hypothetical protein
MDNTSTLLKLLENIHETAVNAQDDLSVQANNSRIELNPPDHVIRYLMNYSRALDAIESQQTGLIWLNRN